MTTAEQTTFASMVHPLKPWDEEGHVWAVAIQNGQLVDDPVLYTAEHAEGVWEGGWSEIRLHLVSPDGPTWALWYSRDLDDGGYEVYRGLIPDRQLFCRLLSNASGVRDHAGLLLAAR